MAQERAAGRLPPGYAYRLPTEAEWEYAARGGALGAPTAFAGSDQPEEVAWYLSNSDNTTHPVGQKLPNALGLYDMSGNVFEWCRDFYGPYTADAQDDPTGPPRGTHRVFRGGSWGYGSVRCRVVSRAIGFSPASANPHLGLRLVLGPTLE